MKRWVKTTALHKGSSPQPWNCVSGGKAMPGTAPGSFLASFFLLLPSPHHGFVHRYFPCSCRKTASPIFPIFPASFLLTLPILPTYSVVRVWEQKLHFSQRRKKVEVKWDARDHTPHRVTPQLKICQGLPGTYSIEVKIPILTSKFLHITASTFLDNRNFFTPFSKKGLLTVPQAGGGFSIFV